MGRVEIEQIIKAYEQTGSVWKAGKMLGIAGQQVHDRLRKHGVPMIGNTQWTDEELDELRTMVDSGVAISDMGNRLNRTYAAVACKLNEIGLKNYRRARVKQIKKGTGYDKASMKKHLAFLVANPATKITPYARKHGLHVDSMVNAMQRCFPEQFAAYLAEHHGDITRKECPGCGAQFIPANGKQRYCTRKCNAAHVKDLEYFGGRRLEAAGARERICQVCSRNDPPILHVHHIIGKVNDPDNKHMVALCAGCHRIVGAAARIKGLVDSASAWQRFVRLVWFEAHGDEFAGMDVLPDLGEMAP
jgi:hypothetical protein